MFTKETKTKFLEYVKRVAMRRPHISLLHIVCTLRGSVLNGKNENLIPLINYGSYVIENNPGIAAQPIGAWPILGEPSPKHLMT